MQGHPANTNSLFRGYRPSARPGAVALAIAALAAFLTTSMHARATPGEILVITGANAALRAAPGPESKIIERLDTSDRIMEFERRDGWVRGMLFGAIGREGWVAARHLKPEDRDGDGSIPPARSGTQQEAPAARTSSSEEGNSYVTRPREPVYLYCVDCGPRRRHDGRHRDETRRRNDRSHSELWRVPRDRTQERKPSPVIRVVPRPAPVWGGDPRR